MCAAIVVALVGIGSHASQAGVGQVRLQSVAPQPLKPSIQTPKTIQIAIL
jgi:hypothetical protein